MSDHDPSSITVKLIESQHVPKVDARGKSELAKILICGTAHGVRDKLDAIDRAFLKWRCR
jgi:hypothetical protein